MRRYEKPPMPIEDQARMLISRGLQCSDLPRLEKYLSTIGYYRLSAYWLVYEIPSENAGERSHQFKPNTTFQDVLDLYLFDRKLRLLVLDVLERFEVALRTCFANRLALATNDSHAFMNPALFSNNRTFENGLDYLKNEIGRSHEVFVRHYRDKYDEPPLPPIWAVVEVMTLGSLSRWYGNTKDNAIKKQIAKTFGIPNMDIFGRLLKALTSVRNDCAHHSRLWNRKYTLAPPMIKKIKTQYNEDHPRRLHNFLVILGHMLSHINPTSSWKKRVVELIQTRPDWQVQAMGFSDDWQGQLPWKESV